MNEAQHPPITQNVKVFLRVRPTSASELHSGARDCIMTLPGRKQVRLGDKVWAFDAVLTQKEGQEAVYEQCVASLVAGCIGGYNSTVLAYGQTASGKTYTMGDATDLPSDTAGPSNRLEGHDDDSVDSLTGPGEGAPSSQMTISQNDGVIPRVLCELFSAVERQRPSCSSIELRVAFLEIYNEEIRDLLQPSKPPKDILVREAVGGAISVRGMLEVPVASAYDAMKVFARGSINRTTGSTLMNDSSSRSHAIFTIFLEQKPLKSAVIPGQKLPTAMGKVINSKFHLVDLAGSERAKRTGAVGQRLKESVRINQGLLALSKVISALTDGVRKRQIEGGALFGRHLHVPYRDSKLTRLLQDSLGGNSNTTVIACVSPADSNMQETVNTLKYASKARNIENIPIVNENELEPPPASEPLKIEDDAKGTHVDDAEVSEMRAHITELQSQLNEALSVQNNLGAHDEKYGTPGTKLFQDLLSAHATLLKVREAVLELSNEPTLGRKAQVALKKMLVLTEEAASVYGTDHIDKRSMEGISFANQSSPWSAVTVARDLQAELFHKNSTLKETSAELALCKEDLARDEEIFAVKLKELRREQAAASLLREQNSALNDELNALKEQQQQQQRRDAIPRAVETNGSREFRETEREVAKQRREAHRKAAVERATEAAAAAATAKSDHDRLALELKQALAARGDLQASASATRASAARHRRRLDEASSLSTGAAGSSSTTASLSLISSSGEGGTGGLGVLGSLAALAREAEEKGRLIRQRKEQIFSLENSAREATKLVDAYRRRLTDLKREIENLRCAAKQMNDAKMYENENKVLIDLRTREEELQKLLEQTAEQEHVVKLKRETDARVQSLLEEVAQLEAERTSLDEQRAKDVQRGYDRIERREREATEALNRANAAVDIFSRHLDEAARRKNDLTLQADSAAAEALAVEKQIQDEEESDSSMDNNTNNQQNEIQEEIISSGGASMTEQYEMQARWFEAQLKQVIEVVQQRQQIMRDIQRREEAAIELRETQQTRRRFLRANIDDTQSPSKAMLRSSHELRKTLNGLSATIKDLDAQIIGSGGRDGDDSDRFTGHLPVSERRNLLAAELSGLEARREEALAQRAALELELEHAESGQEQLREMDDKLEAIQTEIDYKDSEIRRCLQSSWEHLGGSKSDCEGQVGWGGEERSERVRNDGKSSRESTAASALGARSQAELAAEGVETLLLSRLDRAPRLALAELVRQGSLQSVKARLALADEKARASALDERLTSATVERERLASALRAGQEERLSIEGQLDAAAKDLRRIRTEREQLRQLLGKLMASNPSRTPVRVSARALREVPLPPPPPLGAKSEADA